MCQREIYRKMGMLEEKGYKYMAYALICLQIYCYENKK